MKKVLFATTALVASTGWAMADVALSGSAEMGVIGGDLATATGTADMQFHTDIDVTFTMSGETDNGLTFGASIDLDEADDSAAGGSLAFGNATQGGETIFLSGNFGTITMGDTDGAFDWALTEAAIGGSINDDHTSHSGYNGNAGMDGTYDGQIARYDYTFGDFAFAASVELDDADAAASDTVFGLGAKYNAELGGVAMGFGLGYQGAEVAGTDFDIIGVSVDAKFDNGFRAIVNYSDLDGLGGRDNHAAIALGYTAGALTVAGNYGVYDLVGGGDAEGYGLAVDYDLGGGAEVQFGYGHSDPAAGADVDTYSLGVAMSF